MKKKIVGIGVLTGGAYDTVEIQGIGTALKTLDVNTFRVQGLFKGGSVRRAADITVEGEARIAHCEFAERLLLRGRIRITGPKPESLSLSGEGQVIADRLQTGCLSLRGNCRIGSLRAEQVQIDQPESSAKEKDSVVGEVVCDTLTAYRLKAKTVTAGQVDLRGACEIEELICPCVTVSGPECVIRHHVKDPGAAS